MFLIHALRPALLGRLPFGAGWGGLPGVIRMAPWWLRGWTLLFCLVAALGPAALWQLWRLRRLGRRNLELERRLEGAEAQSRSSRALEAASLVDPLTGLHNHKFLEPSLATDAHQARRVFTDLLAEGQDPLAAREDLLLFLMDLDHLGRVNGTWGRSAGDAVLGQFARRLARITRKTDFRVRWYEGTFLLVARRSRRSGAILLARKLLEASRDLDFLLPDGEVIRERWSIGFSVFPLHPREPDLGSWQHALGFAEQCLAAAKQTGRDRWVGAVLIPDADPTPLRGLPQWDVGWAQTRGLVRVDCSEGGFAWPTLPGNA